MDFLIVIALVIVIGFLFLKGEKSKPELNDQDKATLAKDAIKNKHYYSTKAARKYGNPQYRPKNKRAYVYALKGTYTGPDQDLAAALTCSYKIGFSSDIDKRIQELSESKYYNFFSFKKTYFALVDKAYEVEQRTHQLLSDKQIYGEVFNVKFDDIVQAVHTAIQDEHAQLINEEAIPPSDEERPPNFSSTQDISEKKHWKNPVLDKAEKGVEAWAKYGSIPFVAPIFGTLWLYDSLTTKKRRKKEIAGLVQAAQSSEDKGDMKAAYSWYEDAAVKGDLESQLKIAEEFFKHDEERIIPLNKAEHWATTVAEMGNPNLQTMLAQCYLLGKNVPTNYTKAIYWLQKAAKNNFPFAMFLLSAVYRNGLGVKADIIQAYSLLKTASKIDSNFIKDFEDLKNNMTKAELKRAQYFSADSLPPI